MEGLIPFVIHAIKKGRERRQYRCLSEGSSARRHGAGGSNRVPLVERSQPEEGSSRHRRTRSEHPPTLAPGSDFLSSSDPQLVPSRSLAEARYRSKAGSHTQQG